SRPRRRMSSRAGPRRSRALPPKSVLKRAFPSKWEAERRKKRRRGKEGQRCQKTVKPDSEIGGCPAQAGSVLRWSPNRELNPRPLPYQGSALPLSYLGENHQNPEEPKPAVSRFDHGTTRAERGGAS